jgi:hypothetical protein
LRGWRQFARSVCDASGFTQEGRRQLWTAVSGAAGTDKSCRRGAISGDEFQLSLGRPPTYFIAVAMADNLFTRSELEGWRDHRAVSMAQPPNAISQSPRQIGFLLNGRPQALTDGGLVDQGRYR